MANVCITCEYFHYQNITFSVNYFPWSRAVGERKTILNDNLDFQKLVARKDQVVATLQSGIQSSFKQLGITYIAGEASYISDKTFQVNGERVSGKSVILATGSHPFIPPIPGINDVDYLTTDSFFNLKELPQRLVIIGGGIISVELAFAVAPLGVDVTLMITYL